MASQHMINVDLAEVYASKDRKGFIRTLGWGDEIEVLDKTEKHVEIRTTRFEEQQDGSIEPVHASGFIVPSASSGIKPEEVFIEREDSRVLKIDFVDVQQGDASVVETPKGRVVFIDGGELQLFARYLAARYQGTSMEEPKEIDCILLTHGDADHFAGLAKIKESETHPLLWKRLFIYPKRVYHNGLVKRPDSVREAERLGQTLTVDGTTIQINPEEIDNLPKDTADIEDRRNELAGNLSLNQELAFVRRTNEMVRRFGAYEDGKLKLVDRSRADEKEYRVIKVRRIEVDRFLPLDYLSKLDRSRPNIRRLTEHGNSQAEHFLKALSILNTFQTAWDEALQAWAGARRVSQGGEEKLIAVADDVAKTFTSEAKIRLVPPHGSRSGERCYKGKQIQERVKWCLSKNFNLEQARDYHVEGDKVSWWMLATADHLHTPIKVRAEVVVEEGKIACFTLYPLDIETVEELEAEGPQRTARKQT